MMSVPLPEQVEDYNQLKEMFAETATNDYLKHDNLNYFRQILALFDKPEENMGKIVHVTGTNGKGSVTWKVARALETLCSNNKVGLFASPHIYELEERISINGTKISQSDMVDYVNIILKKLHSKAKDGEPDGDNFRIGKIGILVCIAFLYFRDHRVDYSVIEGGIGARLDHTNVVSPGVSVIASIGLDHTSLLGDTVEKIAADKAHIVKPNTPIVIGPHIKETPSVFSAIKERADQLKLSEDQIVTVPLPEFQNSEAENQETAKQVLLSLLPEVKITDAIKEAIYSSPPGRYQRVQYGVKGFAVPCIFDVGHNPAGLEATFSRCQEDFPRYEFILIFGINVNKDAPGICQAVNNFKQITHARICYTDKYKKQLLPPTEILPRLSANLNLEDQSLPINDYLTRIITGGKPITDNMLIKQYCVIVIGSFCVVEAISRSMNVELSTLNNKQIPGSNEMVAVEPSEKSTLALANYYRARMQGKTRALAYDPLKSIIRKHLLEKSHETVVLQILYLGYGTWFSSILIRQACAELGINATVEGVDINKKYIEEAQEQDPEGRYRVVKKGEEIPFPPGTFDMVISVLVLLEQETLDGMTTLISNTKEVMKEGAVLVTVNCATKAYNPKNQWLSMVNDFDENRGVLDDKEHSSGKCVVTAEKSRGCLHVFSDFFWRNRDYKQAYEISGMKLLYQVKPRAKAENDSQITSIWPSEMEKTPFIVHVVEKRSVVKESSPKTTRFLVQVVKKVAPTLGLTCETYSQDWIIALKKKGVTRYLIGNNFDLNTQAAAKICADKTALSQVLSEEAIPHIEHKIFLAPTLEAVGYVPDEGSYRSIIAYAQRYQCNVVLKDNQGSGGNNVHHCRTVREVEAAAMKIFAEQYGLSISPFADIIDEYRVIVLDGEVKLVFKKVRPGIEGNGRDSVKALLLGELVGLPTDQLSKRLSRGDAFPRELDLDRIPAKGERILIGWKHNLSVGAIASTDIDDIKRRDVEKLALKAAGKINIRFASVDIVNVNDELAPFQVMEINSSVMIDAAAKVPVLADAATETYRQAIQCMFSPIVRVQLREEEGSATSKASSVAPIGEGMSCSGSLFAQAASSCSASPDQQGRPFKP